MKSSLLVALFGLMVFITACAPELQVRSDSFLQETGFITDEPCGPPCWRGITPGETTWNDAITIIRDDASLTDLQTRADEESGQIGAAWAQADGDGCCQMFTRDGETVSFIVLQIKPDILLGQVIEIYGEPDYLIPETLTNTQGVFTLFYVDIPMLIYAFFAGYSGALSATSEVVGVGYTTSEVMDLLVKSADPGLHTWDGYQTYRYYADDALEVTPSITMTPSG